MNYYEMLLARKLAKGELPPNAYLLKEASGSLVSFSDGTDLPMPSFVCNIDAVQDLHGYDAPWVGGAGKNKLEVTGTSTTVNGVTFTVNSDGTILANGTSTANIQYNVTSGWSSFPAGDYILNGCPSGLSNINLYVNPDRTQAYYDTGSGVSFSVSSEIVIRISMSPGVTVNNVLFKPMIRLAGVSDSTFAPYSNICPISGHTGVDAVISPTTEASAGTTIAVSWQTETGEVYGGEIDLVSGELTVTDGYIASYNGETLPSTWISDRDTYAEGTSPTTGAEVAYKMANPQTYQLGGNQIQSLLGNNNAWCDTGDVTLEYFGKGAE